MNLNEIKPSHFISRPWESVARKTEAEIVALNIMKIRARLGDRWELTWKEYKRERMKDGAFSWQEESLFEQVFPLIRDVLAAVAFSRSWQEDARIALTRLQDTEPSHD